MVRKRLKRAGRALLFLALGVLLFASLQRVLTQKYKFGAGLTLKGFYGLPDDSVDVLCLGTSHVYEGLSALDLYDLSGNRTYLLSSAGQPIEISRYMLEWALQTQHPQIVIFDVSAFFHDGDNACWRCVLDSMTLRAEKLQLACAYGKKYEAVRALADELGLRYVDLMYDAENLVDFTQDTNDGGNHLNVRGAEKVAVFLAQYLKENYSIPEHRDTLWDSMLEKYRAVTDVAYLQSEQSFAEYLRRLRESNANRLIVLSGKTDCVDGLTEADFANLEQFGLRLIREASTFDAYIAIIRNGKAVYEATSPHRIDYSTTIDGLALRLVSSGWESGADSSMTINGAECSPNSDGMNIAVYDFDTGLLIDQATVNSRYENQPVWHYWNSFALLQAYERKTALDVEK